MLKRLKKSWFSWRNLLKKIRQKLATSFVLKSNLVEFYWKAPHLTALFSQKNFHIKNIEPVGHFNYCRMYTCNENTFSELWHHVTHTLYIPMPIFIIYIQDSVVWQKDQKSIFPSAKYTLMYNLILPRSKFTPLFMFP